MHPERALCGRCVSCPGTSRIAARWRSVPAMQTQGVDHIAWARRIAPLWLAWVMYAVPVAWLALAIQAVLDDTRLPSVNEATTYDENGQLVENNVRPDAELLARIGLYLLMPYSSPMGVELPLIGLAGALAVSVLWLARPRSLHLRAVAAAGAALCVPLVASGVLAWSAREATAKLWAVSAWSSDSTFAMLHAPWVAAGLLSAALGWAFLRVGFGLLPLRPVASVDPDGAPSVPTGADAGVAPEAGNPTHVVPTHVVPTVVVPTAGVSTVGVSTAGVPTAGSPAVVAEPASGSRVAHEWDSRPELPPDFVAPPAGASPFERPAPTAVGESRLIRGEPAEEAEALQVRDPMAVYRRPSES